MTGRMVPRWEHAAGFLLGRPELPGDRQPLPDIILLLFAIPWKGRGLASRQPTDL